MLSTSRVAWIATIILAAAFGAITTLSSGPGPKVATTFEGSVSREGVSAHSFTVRREGAIEVTLNSDGALDGITRLRQELGAAIPVGAGTVMDGEAARRAVAAGAMFLLSPHLGEDVLAAAPVLAEAAE